MTRFERLTLHLGLLAGVLSGAGLGLVKYLGGVEGEFGPEPSPALPWWQHAHVVAVPVLVFGLGLAVAGHARNFFNGRRQFGRRSGVALALLAVPLVFAGQAVQIITAAQWRAWAGWIHAGFGALFAAAYALHWAKRVWARKAKELERRAAASSSSNLPPLTSQP